MAVMQKADLYTRATFTLVNCRCCQQPFTTSKSVVEEVIFLGIQPDVVAFYFPITEKVSQAVQQVYRQLSASGNVDSFELL
ncbi:hydrogenase 3 maturation protease [Serratia sp. DD3]|nr:hydrogenase 3 maturation protease [Serratia sp. DD3]